MNCMCPQRLYVEDLTPRMTLFGVWASKEMIQVKCGYKLWSLTIRLVLKGRGRDTMNMCAQRKAIRGHSEKGTKERGNKICQHLDLGLPVSELLEIHFCCLSHSRLWQP